MNTAVLEKIKKLLRLARSANQHEAALAMQRAFELANRHGVDVDAVDLDTEVEEIAHEYFPCPERMSYLRKRVLSLVMTFFNVDTCVCWKRILFVGRPTDIQIAHYVHDFLIRVGTRFLSDWAETERNARRKVTDTKRKNFIYGFLSGVSQQLNKSRSTIHLDNAKAALAVVETQDRQRYMDDLIGETTSKPLEKPKRVLSALGAGYEKGRETTINQPLSGRTQEALALPAA